MAKSLQGEESWFIDNYKLPAQNTQEVRRNFPGYSEEKHYDLESMREGDYSGMTESDSDTSGKEDGPYTKINKTKGKFGHAPKNKLSAKVDMYNSEKPTGFGKLKFRK
jgi:hypothetical protein